MKKTIKLSLLFIILGVVTYGKCSTFNTDKAIKWIESNANAKSHNCCAWYVMRALQQGNKPAIILPAWAYKYYLPSLGFKQVDTNNYKPQKGDIVVFPKVKHHIFGHIALYTGSQWISDFKQKNIIVAKQYSTYTIFRNTNINTLTQ